MEKKLAEQKLDTKGFLFLGPDNSGKQTIMKQLRISYGIPFTEEEKKTYKPMLFDFIVQSAQVLLDGIQKRNAKVAEETKAPLAALEKGLRQSLVEIASVTTMPMSTSRKKEISTSLTGLLDEKMTDAVLAYVGTQPEEQLVPELGKNIALVWKDAAVKEAHTMHCRELGLTAEWSDYFFSRAETMAADTYLPNNDDILRVRVPAPKALQEYDCTIDGNKWRFINVAGLFNDRKKILQCFDAVPLVAFIVDMSDFDEPRSADFLLQAPSAQTLPARFAAYLSAFEELCNARWFKASHFFLVFNKLDAFTGKISGNIPLTLCFPEYTGGTNVEEAKKFVTGKFLALSKRPADAAVHTVYTTATDKDVLTATMKTMTEFAINADKAKAAAQAAAAAAAPAKAAA